MVRLKGTLRDLEAELKAVTGKWEEEQKEKELYRTKLRNAVKKGRKIETERNEKEEELQGLRLRLEAAAGGAGATPAGPDPEQAAGIEELQAKYAEAVEELEEVTARNLALQDVQARSAEEAAGARAELEAKLADAAREVEGLRERAAAAGAAAGGGGGDTPAAEDVELELQKVKKQLKKAEQQLLFESAAKEGAVADAEKKLQQAEAEKEGMQQEMTVMSAAMRAAAEKVADAAAAESAAFGAEEALKIQVSDLQKQLAEMEGRLKVAEEDDVERETLTAQMRQFRTDNAELNRQYKLLENELKYKQDQLSQAEASIVKLQEEIIEQSQVNSQTREAVNLELQEREEDLEERREELEQSLRAANEQRIRAQEAQRKAEQQILEKEEAMEKMQADQGERNKRFEYVQASFATKEAQLKEGIAALEDERARLLAELGAAEEFRTSQAEEAATHKARLESLSQSVEDSHAAIDSAVEAAVQPYKERVLALERDAAAEREAAAALRARLGQFEQEAANTSSSRERILELEEAKAEEVTALQNALQAVQEEKADLDTQLHTLREHCALLQDQLKGQAAGADGEAETAAGGDIEAGTSDRQEVEILRERVKHAEQKSSGYQTKIAALENKNRELGWQVAMVSTGATKGKAGPAAAADAAREAKLQTVPGMLGVVLRHRMKLIVGYLVVLHALVYFALTHGVFKNIHYGT